MNTPATAPPHPRDGLVDNARAVLILAVVMGHLVMTYHDEAAPIAWMHYFIYLFHMPAFAFMSGAVTRSPSRSARTAIMSLLPLFLAFSTVHLLVRRAFFGEWEWGLYVAPGLLWYLMALMFWRLLLPAFDRLRHPVIASVVLSLAVGLTDRFDTTLSLSRTIVFLPFFLMGHYFYASGARDERLARIRNVPAVVAVAAIGVVAAVATYATVTGHIKLALLAGYRGYADIPGRASVELLERVVVIACTLLVVFALLRLLPRSRTFYSHVGQFSLGIYVLHMYAIYAFQTWLPHLPGRAVLVALVFLSPFVLVFLLASPPVRAGVNAVDRGARRAFGLLLKPEPAAAPTGVAPSGPAVADSAPAVGGPAGPTQELSPTRVRETAERKATQPS
jgi:fucose 4-O-acetylase-like acetyltransferase